MQQLMCNKGKKFEKITGFRKPSTIGSEAPVRGMPRGKSMYVLDAAASVLAISRIMHQEQEWNGRFFLRPNASGSGVLSDSEIKCNLPKAEMFAVVRFVKKFRAYLGGAPFKKQVSKRALSWLKTDPMEQIYTGCWIVRLDGTRMLAVSARKLNFMKDWRRSKPVRESFSFLDKKTYEALPLSRWLDKSGHPIAGHPELPLEKAAQIKIISKKELVPLDLLIHSNLAQQELSRMNINSLSVLDKMGQVTPEGMRMVAGL